MKSTLCTSVFYLFNAKLLRNIYDYSIKHDRTIIGILGILTGVLWYITQPIIFTYDSFAYVDAAKSMAGLENGHFPYFRAPLLPALLAITRVCTIPTFDGFLLVQLLLGISIIMIMHSCFRRISRYFGLFMSVLFLSTFMAFVHSKSVMTEEIYLFGWCLCLDGSLAYVMTKNRWRLAEIIIALLILLMTRAQGGFVAFVILPLLAFHLPNRIPEIFIGAIFLFITTFGYSILHAPKMDLINKKTTASTTGLGVTNTTGKMIFMVVYWDPYRRMNWSLVHPINGPASKRLFSNLQNFYRDQNNLIGNPAQPKFSSLIENPEKRVWAMEYKPNGQYWWAIWNALDEKIGVSAADKLLMQVTLETIWAHPLKVAVIYLRNFVVDMVAPDSNFVWSHPSFGSSDVGEVLAAEMVKSGNSAEQTKLAGFLNIYFPLMMILLMMLDIILTPLIWKSNWRFSWVICVVLLTYNHLTVVVAATPESRYTMYAFPILLIIMMMGIDLVMKRWIGNRARGINKNYFKIWTSDKTSI